MEDKLFELRQRLIQVLINGQWHSHSQYDLSCSLGEISIQTQTISVVHPPIRNFTELQSYFIFAIFQYHDDNYVFVVILVPGQLCYVLQQQHQS